MSRTVKTESSAGLRVFVVGLSSSMLVVICLETGAGLAMEHNEACTAGLESVDCKDCEILTRCFEQSSLK